MIIKSIFETLIHTETKSQAPPNSKALNQIYRFIYYRISYIYQQLENPKIQHVIDNSHGEYNQSIKEIMILRRITSD